MAKGSDVRGLTADDDLRNAAIKILWTRFEDMWTYHAGVSKDFDADAVHDMRVASRRLRTAMQTFRPCFSRKTFRRHYACIKEVADQLGEVRDRDVLLEELKGDVERLAEDQRAGVEAVMDRLRSERAGHRQALSALLEDLDRQAYDREFLAYLARQT
jgi:CHAD domain-containing protein